MIQTYTIDSGYFNAGAILKNGICMRAAPIIKYMIGWDAPRIIGYCIKKKWEFTVRDEKDRYTG